MFESPSCLPSFLMSQYIKDHVHLWQRPTVTGWEDQCWQRSLPVIPQCSGACPSWAAAGEGFVYSPSSLVDPPGILWGLLNVPLADPECYSYTAQESSRSFKKSSERAMSKWCWILFTGRSFIALVKAGCWSDFKFIFISITTLKLG